MDCLIVARQGVRRMSEDTSPDKPAREFAGQLKGWFSRQPAASEHVHASEHLTHGARENEQLAEIVGQLQHLITLFEAAYGRPRYDPLIVNLSGLTAATVNVPNGPCQLEYVILSTDTNASDVQIIALAPSAGPTGQKTIWQGRLAANTSPSPALPLNYLIPPDCTGLQVIMPAAPGNAWFTFLFTPVIPGGFPYAR